MGAADNCVYLVVVVAADLTRPTPGGRAPPAELAVRPPGRTQGPAPLGQVSLAGPEAAPGGREPEGIGPGGFNRLGGSCSDPVAAKGVVSGGSVGPKSIPVPP